MAYSPFPISSHSRFSFPNTFHCLLFSHQCHFCFPVVYLVFHNSFFFQFFFSSYFIKISAYYFSPEIISVAPHCLQYQVQTGLGGRRIPSSPLSETTCIPASSLVPVLTRCKSPLHVVNQPHHISEPLHMLFYTENDCVLNGL